MTVRSWWRPTICSTFDGGTRDAGITFGDEPRRFVVFMGFCVAAVQSAGGGVARTDSNSDKPDFVAVGYEIFNREWVPNDPRATAATGSGRSITIPPASPATTRGAAAVRGRSARTSIFSTHRRIVGTRLKPQHDRTASRRRRHQPTP